MVLHFCPNCANLLRYELASDGGRFACRTCPYVAYIQPGAKIKEQVVLNRKKFTDIVVSENDELDMMQKADASCPNCHHGKAAFYEQQTRSADEPSTLFFTCLECKHKWNQ